MVQVVTNADEVMAELVDATEELVKKIAVNATSELVIDTPRDTSWARSNWIPNIGSPAQGTDGTAEQAAEGNVHFGRQQTGIADIITSYNIKKGAVFISNNVPYVLKLNEGTSDQAPSGFIQIAILNAIKQVNFSL